MAAMKEVQETAGVDLGILLDAGDGAIVTLVSGDTRLAAHRAVLAARSPVFAAMFGHDTLEASSSEVTIPDVEGPVLRQLTAYLYTLQAPRLSGTAPQLLVAADKYGVSCLKAHCEQQLATQLTVENAAATAVLAMRHSCSSLRQAALQFIRTCPLEVMATQGWADAMLSQPKDLIEVSRQLYEPPAETRAPVATGSRATTTAGALRQPHSRTAATAAPPSPPPDEAAVSQMRSLSAEERNSRLIEVAKQGEVGELGALLAAGADVEARAECERTALHWAADGGHEDMVRRLLEAGAQVDARDNQQNTPLHFAADQGLTAVVRLLLSCSADPNARDEDGRTPLHDAASRGCAEAAAALLEAGGERMARDDGGRTPLDLALEEDNQQLIQLLS